MGSNNVCVNYLKLIAVTRRDINLVLHIDKCFKLLRKAAGISSDRCKQQVLESWDQNRGSRRNGLNIALRTISLLRATFGLQNDLRSLKRAMHAILWRLSCSLDLCILTLLSPSLALQWSTSIMLGTSLTLLHGTEATLKMRRHSLDTKYMNNAGQTISSRLFEVASFTVVPIKRPKVSSNVIILKSSLGLFKVLSYIVVGLYRIPAPLDNTLQKSSHSTSS